MNWTTHVPKQSERAQWPLVRKRWLTTHRSWTASTTGLGLQAHGHWMYEQAASQPSWTEAKGLQVCTPAPKGQNQLDRGRPS